MAKVSKSSNVSKGNRSVHSMACRECGTMVDKVDINASGVTCWKCVSRLCGARPISDTEELLREIKKK
jgi:hypothetical protein